MSKNQKALEEQIDVFEKRKLKDLKKALLDFVKIELALHAKAVELYTQAYNDVSDIDEALDLEVSLHSEFLMIHLLCHQTQHFL